MVYPDRKDARLKEDSSNGCPSLILEEACYELRNVRTINADWTFQKVEQ